MALIINGEKIEDGVVKQEVERLRGDYERAFADMEEKEREEQLWDWSKENVTERVLITQHVKSNGPEIPEDEVKAALEKAMQQYQPDGDEKLSAEDEKKIREAVTEQLKVEKFIDELCKNIAKPSMQQISEFYEEHKGDFKTPEQIKVSHIVRHINAAASEEDARQQIEQARKELEKGESFELTARKYSDCPDNDGDLGYITKDQMVEEFEDVVFNMGVDEISPVFTTRFGFHIAKVYDRKPEGAVELDKVKDDISNYLMEQKKTGAMERFVDKLKEKADIKEA